MYWTNLRYAAAAQSVCAPLNNMDLAWPDLWEPLGQFLCPCKSQARRHHNQQGPLILQQQTVL